MESKNIELLKSFTDYCVDHPQERFWQALRNWADVGFIYKSEVAPMELPREAQIALKDTFYE